MAFKISRHHHSCFPHFSKTSSETLDFIGLSLKSGCCKVIFVDVLRKLKNRSGSISVQIILKASGKYKDVKTIGTGSSEQEIVKIWFLGKQELERLHAQSRLFVSENDLIVEQVFESLKNANIRTVGPELVFGRIYDHIGFNAINEDLLRHLVIARLAFKQVKDHRLCISLSTRDARY